METDSESVIATYTVAIDPGHQGNWVDMSEMEPNAPGSSVMKRKATTGTQGSYTGIPEYQLNLDISLALRKKVIGWRTVFLILTVGQLALQIWVFNIMMI